MKNKGKFIFAAICGILTIILILLIGFADVAPIGPAGTSIGLSHINKAAADLVGTNQLWYNITKLLGYVALLTAFFFTAAGFIQLITRKSIQKVDKEILSLGVLYAATVGLYIFFEIAVINYRPVIMPGEVLPEASFPSSHTMLICVIMGSTMMVMNKYVKNAVLCRILCIICAVILTVTVIGRMLSGVHWLTDITGGVLISAVLLSLFSGIKDKLSEK